ncbi:hypothetical protein COCC4DRAFT_177655 [Bipolaris maydis ATCC 48331]|uniref:Uncharacterized protein n=2 Tax=Cochliobolus heterostrophus TaxID=5016 RepID=M2TA33_COCH5|nr:uncharacterized protein COCC4DRAFT_177655 [Bipolaris maydis ATCC 48331]EMD94395.1 hypothetical protein COCHEDRAFT_1192480 [Bipolaris maydis C5]ENI01265.1 hypothetical protein COCC4DRAFT_177655 [Bipolaris maydis ATCC 48331]
MNSTMNSKNHAYLMITVYLFSAALIDRINPLKSPFCYYRTLSRRYVNNYSKSCGAPSA